MHRIKIERLQRGNHIRNIRIIPEDKEHTDYVTNPFRKEYLDMMRPFHTIRFVIVSKPGNSEAKLILTSKRVVVTW